MQETILFIKECVASNNGQTFKYLKYFFVVNGIEIPVHIDIDYKKIGNQLVRKYLLDNE